jgi:hypothetical protein
MPVSTYEAAEHRFRFAAWAAGRAYGRGETDATVEAGQIALRNAGLIRLASYPSELPKTPEEFDAEHSQWVAKVQSSFGSSISYGRAAKLINVFLKSIYLMDFGSTRNPDVGPANQIHPPIDRLLLDALARKFRHDRFWKAKRDVGWTRFDRNDYSETIAKIRDATQGQLWRIEEQWLGNRP